MSDRRGRLDLLIQDGLGMVADRIGIREHAQPLIDRFVNEKVKEHRIPVTPIEVAEHCGLLKKTKPPKVEESL